MKKEYLENILTLLTVVILIDDKVYPEEVEAFAKAVQKISEHIDPNILFTSSMAADWFKANRENVQIRLKSNGAETLIRKLVNNIKSMQGNKDVFFNMIRIAHADAEYHKTEHNLLRIAAEAWDIPYSADRASIVG